MIHPYPPIAPPPTRSTRSSTWPPRTFLVRSSFRPEEGRIPPPVLDHPRNRMTDETELREMSLKHDRELLAVESLSKTYGGARRLRSADLHVRAAGNHPLLRGKG